MKIDTARNLLGIFFLGATAFVGVYILVFQQTRLLPISGSDATSAFQIIIPTFVAQLTIIFKWLSDPPAPSARSARLPTWAVVLPPVIVFCVLVFTIVFLALYGAEIEAGALFKNIVTFCVSLLSATTIFIVTAIFSGGTDAKEVRRDSA